jgi:hypothetical protein
MHLIEAALAAHRLVASQDEHAREAFRAVADSVATLRAIVWVNPTLRQETPVAWLRNGAIADARRQLGA